MKVIQSSFELSKIDYYKTHFKILNAVLPIDITDKEIDILSNFLSLPVEMTNENMFNSMTRKKVIEALTLTNGGMSNHLKNMKKKGYLIRNGEYLIIHPNLLPAHSVQGYNFKLKTKNE